MTFNLIEAQKLRDCNVTWKGIADLMGVGPEYVRRRLDPEWARYRQNRINELRNAKKNGARPRLLRPPKSLVSQSKKRERDWRSVSMSQSDKADGYKKLAEIPPDTRDLTAKICGDPLPGRSALDRTTWTVGDEAVD
jgi:hypothetical protein